MGSTDGITVWGCLCITPWRQEGLQPSPWHVAVLPFAPVKACRITLSSAQEQPVLQIRDSIPGSPVGFFIQTCWESTSHLGVMLREGWLVPSPLAVNRESHPVTSIQASKATLGKQGSGKAACEWSCTVYLEKHRAPATLLSPSPHSTAATPQPA